MLLQHPLAEGERRAQGLVAGTLAEGQRELRMSVGQRIAHVAPEGGLRIRDPFDEVVVGPGDVLPKVVSGKV